MPDEYRDSRLVGDGEEQVVPDGQVFRAGRSPQFLERQPHLGFCAAREHLRQGRLRLLAARQDGPREIALTSARSTSPGKTPGSTTGTSPREVESGILALDVDVARQPAQPERQPPGEGTSSPAATRKRPAVIRESAEGHNLSMPLDRPERAGSDFTSAPFQSAGHFGGSGVLAGSKRATTLPLRSTRNLVKFHLISPAVLRDWYCRR